jgi:hypothetical protein
MKLLTSCSTLSSLAILGALAAGCSDAGTHPGPVTAAPTAPASPDASVPSATQGTGGTSPGTIAFAISGKQSMPVTANGYTMPSGEGWTVTAFGTGFPIGKLARIRVWSTLDGNKFPMMEGAGILQPDLKFGLEAHEYCPSGMTDLYAEVISDGIVTTSQHLVPPC